MTQSNGLARLPSAAASMLGHSLRTAGIDVRPHLDPMVLRILADEDEIHQVLMNQVVRTVLADQHCPVIEKLFRAGEVRDLVARMLAARPAPTPGATRTPWVDTRWQCSVKSHARKHHGQRQPLRIPSCGRNIGTLLSTARPALPTWLTPQHRSDHESIAEPQSFQEDP